MRKIFCQANAKINLSFKILGKAKDGLHYIESIIQSINLSDYLIFSRSKHNYLTGSYVCLLKDNLILKTQKVIEERFKEKFPLEVHLQKVIPVAAGLGGGSADAAATIIAINKLYNLGLSKKKMTEVGFKVGCDVPFFIYGGMCRVEGRGEKIETLSRERKSNFYLILRPHKRLETKKVYSLYDKTGKSFCEIAQQFCPDVKLMHQYLLKFKPIELGMSGSGPSLFAGFRKYEEVTEIAKKLADFNGDIYITKPVKEGVKYFIL
jgi:4-diphosphocytidyl-2-C-methyl-D-erythritol kinase